MAGRQRHNASWVLPSAEDAPVSGRGGPVHLLANVYGTSPAGRRRRRRGRSASPVKQRHLSDTSGGQRVSPASQVPSRSQLEGRSPALQREAAGRSHTRAGRHSVGVPFLQATRATPPNSAARRGPRQGSPASDRGWRPQFYAAEPDPRRRVGPGPAATGGSAGRALHATGANGGANGSPVVRHGQTYGQRAMLWQSPGRQAASNAAAAALAGTEAPASSAAAAPPLRVAVGGEEEGEDAGEGADILWELGGSTGDWGSDAVQSVRSARSVRERPYGGVRRGDTHSLPSPRLPRDAQRSAPPLRMPLAADDTAVDTLSARGQAEPNGSPAPTRSASTSPRRRLAMDLLRDSGVRRPGTSKMGLLPPPRNGALAAGQAAPPPEPSVSATGGAGHARPASAEWSESPQERGRYPSASSAGDRSTAGGSAGSSNGAAGQDAQTSLPAPQRILGRRDPPAGLQKAVGKAPAPRGQGQGLAQGEGAAPLRPVPVPAPKGSGVALRLQQQEGKRGGATGAGRAAPAPAPGALWEPFQAVESVAATAVSGYSSLRGRHHPNEDRYVAVDVLPEGTVAGSDGQHVRDRYYAVFDGHGGSRTSEYCATTLHRRLCEVLYGKEGAEVGLTPLPTPGADSRGGFGAAQSARHLKPRLLSLPTGPALKSMSPLARCVRRAVMLVEKEYCSRARRERDDSGACALVAVVRGRHLVVACSGDCRAVMGYASGHWRDLTVDHTAMNREEIRRIRNAGGTVIGGRVYGVLQPSRSLGDVDLKAGSRRGVTAAPSITEAMVGDAPDDELAADGLGAGSGGERCLGGNGRTGGSRGWVVVPGVGTPRSGAGGPAGTSFLLLATDGLWDVFSSGEAIRFAAHELWNRGRKPAQAGETLAREARRRGSLDDITVLITLWGV